MSGERLLVEHGLHLRTQAIEATTHVGHAGGQPYLRSGAKFDHLRKLSRIDLSSDGSAPRSTLIMALPETRCGSSHSAPTVPWHHLACIAGGLTGRGHHNRKKRCRWRSSLAQFAPFQRTTPLEYLVRVHTVSPCHESHTRTRLQGQLRNPPLLRHRSPSANRPCRTYLTIITHDDIVVLKPAVMPEGNSGRLHTHANLGDSSSHRAGAISNPVSLISTGTK